MLQGKPHSVEDALKLALEYEAFQKGRRGRYGDVRTFVTQRQDLALGVNEGNGQDRGSVGGQNRGANVNSRRKQCNFCKRLGHFEKDCYQKKNLQNNGVRACYYCNSSDHLIRDCETRRSNLQKYANHRVELNELRPKQGKGNQNMQEGNYSENGC